MDVAAADDLLAGQALVVPFQAHVGLLGSHLTALLPPVGEGMSPGRCNTCPSPLSGRHDLAPQAHNLVAQLLEGVAYGGTGLDL